MRIEQEERLQIELQPGEMSTLSAALETASNQPAPGTREADFEFPDNPRRARLLLEKIRPLAEQGKAPKPEPTP
jgi:hypothetical protein